MRARGKWDRTWALWHAWTLAPTTAADAVGYLREAGLGDDSVGSIITTPSEMAAMLKDLDADADRLERCVGRERGYSPRLGRVVNGVLGVEGRLCPDQGVHRLRPVNVVGWHWRTRLNSYREKLQKWEKTLESFGGTMVGPPIANPNAGANKGLDMTALMPVVGMVAAAVIVSNVAGMFRK